MRLTSALPMTTTCFAYRWAKHDLLRAEQ